MTIETEQEAEGFDAYMCLIDFECEQGDPIEGTPLYSSLDGLRRAHGCVDGCGYARVRVSLIVAVPPQISGGQ